MWLGRLAAIQRLFSLQDICEQGEDIRPRARSPRPLGAWRKGFFGLCRVQTDHLAHLTHLEKSVEWAPSMKRTAHRHREAGLYPTNDLELAMNLTAIFFYAVVMCAMPLMALSALGL